MISIQRLFAITQRCFNQQLKGFVVDVPINHFYQPLLAMSRHQQCLADSNHFFNDFCGDSSTTLKNAPGASRRPLVGELVGDCGKEANKCAVAAFLFKVIDWYPLEIDESRFDQIRLYRNELLTYPIGMICGKNIHYLEVLVKWWSIFIIIHHGSILIQDDQYSFLYVKTMIHEE